MAATRPPRVLALWAAPRSRSTVFFRSMLERTDLIALHEPFCNLLDHGETVVDGQVVRSAAELISAIRTLSESKTVFFKDTTDQRHPAVLADEEFFAEVRHTFLIRRPDEVAASYYALKPDMDVAEVGIEHLHEVHRKALAVSAGGPGPVVVDSADLVADPAGVLRSYCAAVGLPFRPESLTWESGTRQEWSHTERWHGAVSDSTGFSTRGTDYADTAATNPLLAGFSAHHQPFYQELHQIRLTAV
jgi:hypothetical protein